MVVGLLGSGMSFLGFSLIQSYWGMAAVMIVTGLTSPFYQLGSDSMVADLVPEKELESAYAYTRVAMNVGFAVGPFAGGFLVSFSHQLALQVAGLFTVLASVAIFLMVKETMPETFKPGVEAVDDGEGAEVKSGYASVFRNKSFLVFSVAFLLTQFGYLPALSLGSLFAKSTLGIPESVYGIVPAINGVMNILFLVAVAGWAKGRNSLLVLGLGSLLYSLGTGSFYLNQGIGWMIASMTVITIGELMVVPTAITFVSKSAPSDSRGTYLGVFNLMTMLVIGLAPVIFGLITDASNMRNAWLIMSAISLIGCVIFFLAGRIQQQAPAAEAT